MQAQEKGLINRFQVLLLFQMILVGVLVARIELVEAQKSAPPPPGEKEETVKTGVVASYGTSARTSQVDYSGADTQGDEPTAVTGSIKRKGAKCSAVLTNNGEESYSIGYVVEGHNAKTRKQNFRRSYTTMLSSGKSTEKFFACPKGNLQVRITRAKKLGKKK